MTTLRSYVSALLLSSLSACGITYETSRVSDQGTDFDVQIITMTPETVLVANRQAYAPRSLPEVFYLGAGGGTPRSSGGLPDAPVFPTLTPDRLDLRPPPAAEPGPYRLGAGDVLRLALASGRPVDPITGSTDGQTAQQELVVRDDGAVSIPQVGSVDVIGLTIEEAEARIFERLIDAGIDPDFGVQVSGFNSQRISIGGAVAAEQVLALNLNRTNLAQALALAGGITAPDPEFVSIRMYRDGTLYQIPLEAFRARADLQNIAVLPGDAIFVDTTYDLDRAQSFYENQIGIIALRRGDRTAALGELATEIGLRRAALAEQRDLFIQRETLGAEERDFVYLAGEVNRQSRWPLPYGQQASLADALFDSGGFDIATGNPAHIYVLRASVDAADWGTVIAWHLDTRNAINLALAPRFEMRPDDIIFIEEQPITSWNRAVQQSLPSLITSIGSAVQ